MDYNYHTHTKRCGHASGEVENYIKRAIEGGIKYMGFSDHIPFIFPDGYESYYRIPVIEVEEYFNEIKALREKYKDKIDIKIGFEVEYYPEYFAEMISNAIKWGAEYLILGQHFIYNEHPNGVWTGMPTDSEEKFKEYIKCTVDAINSGAFTYVAHPDILRYTGDFDFYCEQMSKICVASKNRNIPLEINFLGIRDKRLYPYDKFWEIAGTVQCPVTYGFDAHDEISAFDAVSLIKAEELVEKYNLNYIGRPEIKNIK